MNRDFRLSEIVDPLNPFSVRRFDHFLDFPASMGLREMIIPNANTIQQNYFLKTLSLDNQLPLLFVGPTGR